MPSPSTAAKRVTLFVTRRGAQPIFTPITTGNEVQPHLLGADNLGDALTLTRRLRQDCAAGTVLTLLHIDTTTLVFASVDDVHSKGFAAPQVITFSSSPRLLAGLISDAVTVGVADGAVIRTVDNPLIPHQLRTEVAGHLECAGFEVSFYVPDWVLDEDGDSIRPAS